MFGVTSPALNWLRFYLTDRTQLVRQWDDLSIPMLLHTGLPQGSVLRPILFSSFISPVHCIATQFGVHRQQYADDTQLYMEIPSDPGLTYLESALLSFSFWFLHNGLALNPKALSVSLSTATGMKQCVWRMASYFSCLRHSASLATTPGPVTSRFRRLLANMSQHVTSHIKHRPCFHGIKDIPSGRLPSDLDNDVSFLNHVFVTIFTYYVTFTMAATAFPHIFIYLFYFMLLIFISITHINRFSN
jgi:hypothetical protein